MGFALDSLARLRTLYGIDSVLVVLGTVAEAVGVLVDLRTFHHLVDAVEFDVLDLVGLVLGLGLLALELVVGIALGLGLLEL